MPTAHRSAQQPVAEVAQDSTLDAQLQALCALRQELVDRVHGAAFVLWPDPEHRRRVARYHLQPAIPYRNPLPGGALLQPDRALRAPPMAKDPMRQLWVDLLDDRPPAELHDSALFRSAFRHVVHGKGYREPIFFSVAEAAYQASDAVEWVGAETVLAAGLGLRRDRQGGVWLVQSRAGIPWSAECESEAARWEPSSPDAQAIRLRPGRWVLQRQDNPTRYRRELLLSPG